MRPDNPSTLGFYLTILRRRWRPMLVALLVPVAIAVAITVATKKQYQATALVVINRQSLADELNGTPDPSAASSDFLNIITTYAEAAHSTQVAAQVAAAVPAAGMTASQILNNSTVTAQQDADVVAIAVRDQNPTLALRLSSAFARQFVSYERGLGVSAIDAALHQVDLQLAQARNRHRSSLVSSLSDRDDQLRTLRSLQTANDYVVNPTNSATLVSPRKSLNIGLGLFGGILLAVLLAAVLEALDTRVRTSDDIEAAIGAPLLGRLGGTASTHRDQLLSLRDPSSAAAERFRVIRTNLELRTVQLDGKVIMVTSCAEEEGGSLTAANLATATARAGRRVILLDLDLRDPSQDGLFETGGRAPGFTDVLAGGVDLEQALLEVPLAAGAPNDQDDVSTPERSLRLLRAGQATSEPGELVSSEQAADLIRRVRELADVVYVDCPAALPTSDALAISRSCDVVIIVARLARVRRRALYEISRAFSTSPARLAGFVVTGDKGFVKPAAQAPAPVFADTRVPLA